jgi:hypothetical protein
MWSGVKSIEALGVRAAYPVARAPVVIKARSEVRTGRLPAIWGKSEMSSTVDKTEMTLPSEPSEQPTSAKRPSSETLKFSTKRLALAFAIAGVSDAIGAFATPLPPIVWVVDIATALLLFMVLGRQWLLLPGLALEAIPGLGVLPFWLLVVAAIAVLGTPRPKFERH